jgi:hypothetical protein
MVDSGATLNFIHESIVRRLSLKTTPCTPTRITVADGRVLCHATRQVTLDYHIAKFPQRDTFLVAPIGDHSIILGMPWLERVNPQINWITKTIERFLETDESQTLEPPPTGSTPGKHVPRSRDSPQTSTPSTPPDIQPYPGKRARSRIPLPCKSAPYR